jgi:hypothetical protein
MLPTSVWDTYREVLSTALADDDWDERPVVFGTMEQHRRLLMSQPPGAELTNEGLHAVAASAAFARRARERLERAQPLTD